MSSNTKGLSNYKLVADFTYHKYFFFLQIICLGVVHKLRYAKVVKMASVA